MGESLGHTTHNGGKSSGQLIFEKMLNLITNHKNANQNDNKIPFYIHMTGKN